MEYAIKGKYTFHGEEHSQVGLITVDDVTEAITGFIMDPISSCLRHEVTGQVSYKGVKIILDFAKKPTNNGTLATIFYRLEKSGHGKKTDMNQTQLNGTYTGSWSFRTNEELGDLCIGHHPEMGEVVVIRRETEKENKAHLTLDSKI